MFNNKRNNAIGRIWQQYDKIEQPGGGGNANMPWVIQTRSLILECFGPESDEYKYAEKFVFRDQATTEPQFGHNVYLAQEFLKRCAETLGHRKLYKPYKKNWLQRVDDKSLNAWIIAGVFTCLAIGKGEEMFENRNDSRILKQQTDSITLYRNKIDLLNDSILKLKTDTTKHHS